MSHEGEQEEPDLVARLFLEYCERRDAGEEVDVEELLERAGEHAPALEKRITTFEMLSGRKAEITPERGGALERVGRFEILSSLGSGGLSHVYLAHDPHLEREVALKILDQGLVPDRRERAWILNEARSLALLKHEGVVQVLEVGSSDGYDYVALEHLAGPTLAQVLAELHHQSQSSESPEPVSSEVTRLARSLSDFGARARLFKRLAEALAYCHNRGVIHRDIKPANVVFSGDGIPKLIDFGLAHHEEAEEDAKPMITHELVGSAAYVAPEQIEHNQTGADPRSDQFSLATVFYESLALVNPFDAPTTLQTTQAVLRCEVRDISKRVRGLPRDLGLIVHRALERDPDRRYPSVHEMADDLGAFLEHRPISVAPPSVPRRLALWTRRHWVPLLVATALVVTGLGTLLASWFRDVRGEQSRLRQALADITNAELQNEDEFWQAGLDLATLRTNSQSFDARFGSDWFGSPLELEAEQAIHRWSDRLATAIPPKTKAESPLWPTIVRLEEDICPSCTANLEERELGVVAYPLEAIGERPWQLDRVVLSDDKALVLLEYHEEISPIRFLPVGTYRLRVWEDEAEERLAHELGFVVSRPRAPKRELVLNDRFAPPLGDGNRLLESAVLIPGMLVIDERGREVRMTEEVLMASRWVSVEEYAAFRASPAYRRHCREVQRKPIPPGGDESYEWRNDGINAWVDLDAALAFAEWIGGRLPSAEEMYVAASQDLIEVLADEGAREWLRNQTPFAGEPGGMHYLHAKFRPNCLGCGTADAHRRQFLMLEDGMGIAFRVVFPAR